MLPALRLVLIGTALLTVSCENCGLRMTAAVRESPPDTGSQEQGVAQAQGGVASKAAESLVPVATFSDIYLETALAGIGEQLAAKGIAYWSEGSMFYDVLVLKKDYRRARDAIQKSRRLWGKSVHVVYPDGSLVPVTPRLLRAIGWD